PKFAFTRSAVTSRNRTSYASWVKTKIPTLLLSPLSPERAWAISCSRMRAISAPAGRRARAPAPGKPRFAARASSGFLHPHARLEPGLGDERRPVGDDLLRLGTSAGEAGDARGARGDERRDLLAESLDRGCVLPLRAEPQHDFAGIVHRGRDGAVARIDAQ